MLRKKIDPSHTETPENLIHLVNFSGAQPGVRKILSAHRLDALVVLDSYDGSSQEGERHHIQDTLNQRSPKNLWLTTLFDRLIVRARCMGLDPNNIGFIARSHASSGYMCEPPSQKQNHGYRMGMTNAVVKNANSESGFRDATLGEVGFEGIEGLQLEVVRRVGDNLMPSHIAGMPFSTPSIITLRDQFAALHKFGLTSDDIQIGSKFHLECSRGQKLSATVDNEGRIILGTVARAGTALFRINERLDGMSHLYERAMFLEGDLHRGTKPEESFPVVLKHEGVPATLPILRMIREE